MMMTTYQGDLQERVKDIVVIERVQELEVELPLIHQEMISIRKKVQTEIKLINTNYDEYYYIH